MSGHRVSIRGLMTFVVLLAVLFASLREPTDLWASSMFTVAVGVSGVALLGTIFARGERRATWAGVLVFGTGYLLICFGPGFDTHIMPRLLTTALADDHYARMSYSPTRDGETVWVERQADQIRTEFVEGRKFGNVGDVAMAHTTSSYIPSSMRALSPDAFRQLCHADLSLLFALVGAAIARRFAARPEPARGNEAIHETPGGDR